MQKYTINQPDVAVCGTSLKGYVTTTYDKLVELFGTPAPGSSDGKTTCEWVIKFEDGTVGTIHDWKTNSTPMNLYKWSIGGFSERVVELIQQVMSIRTTVCKF